MGQPKKKSTKRSPKKKGKKQIPRFGGLLSALLVLGEVLFFVVAAVIALMILLGALAGRFTGTTFFANLLPFAFGVLLLVFVCSGCFWGWLRVRPRISRFSRFLPVGCAGLLMLLIGLTVVQGRLYWAFDNFRTLVGGRAEVGKITLTHQVFAAYRRLNLHEIERMIARAQPYRKDIDAAAQAYNLDPDLLHGIAAVESSFLPRESKDGGDGLFQITLIPRHITKEVASRLKSPSEKSNPHLQDSFLAAATLRYYFNQMQQDPFLGLLAYNIGPKNDNLHFIREQYGARDFITIQPYLKKMPRDYPIRVLAYALAFRLYRSEGKLIAYEEGLNAIRIQQIGIPGL